METVLGFLGIIGILASLAAAGFAVNWVLGPLDRAAKDRRYLIQFTLADFLCLFVQTQLLLACHPRRVVPWCGRQEAGYCSYGRDHSAGAFGLVDRRTHPVAPGVHDTRGRALTLVIGIPVGYALSLAIPAVACMILDSLASPGLRIGSRDGLPTGILILAELAIILVVWGLSIMTRHILVAAEQQSKPPAAEPPP